MSIKYVKTTLLLCLALILIFVAGCSNQSTGNTDNNKDGGNQSEEENNAAGDEQKEPVKVSVFKSHLGPGTLPESDDPYLQHVADKIGVEYELITSPPGSAPNEYINILIASEELPDILRPIGGVEQTLIQQGGALALDDLLPKYAPHAWERIPKEAWDVVRTASDDGKIYYIPKVYLIPERAAMIRQDWLDTLELGMPETVEDYIQVLTAFRDGDPNGNGEADELPTSGREFGRWMDHLFAIYGVAMWEGYPEWAIYDGKLQYAGITDNMRASIQFIRKLYEEKLLDNETFLNKGDVWQSKINNNLVGSWYHLPAKLKDKHDAMMVDNPDAYITGMPLPKAEGFEGFITKKSMGQAEWMIPKSSEDNAINALKLLDFFYNPENDEFVRFGIEGIQHEIVDGEKQLLPAADDKPIALGMANLTDKASMDVRIEETYREEQQQQMVKDIFVVSTADAKRIAGDGMPSSVYEGFPDINSHKLFLETLTKIVIGDWPIEKFDEFVEQWKASGGDTVTKRAQDWYAKIENNQ